MSVHKIRANSAEVKGEFVFITKNSLKSLWFIFGCINGFLTAFLINQIFNFSQYANEIIILYYFVVIIISGFVFILIPKRVDYQIPKSDLLAIKRYPMDRMVTVVFDDQRMKGVFLPYE